MQDIAGVHTPVLLPQVLAALNIRAGGNYMDATYGRGGHAGAILEKLIANGRLLCIDRDPAAVAAARARFSQDSRVSIFSAPFSALALRADEVEPGLKFDGILFDLGVSSPQIDDAARGFSFMQDGPLDMRMSAGEGMSAADVVNRASLEELIRIFREYGEERMAPRIARAIVMDPEILIYDEPFVGLDPISLGVILRLIRRCHNKSTFLTYYASSKVRGSRNTRTVPSGVTRFSILPSIRRPRRSSPQEFPKSHYRTCAASFFIAALSRVTSPASRLCRAISAAIERPRIR